MKGIAPVLLLVGIATCLVHAADVKTNAEVVVKTKTLSPDDRVQYVDLVRQELEAGTQLKLLTSLADEFHALATEPPSGTSSEKIAWQAELAQKFRERSSAAQGRFNDATRKRLAFELEHGALPAPVSLLGALGDSKPLNPAELAYVTKLDERVLGLREQLAQVEQENKTLLAQLQTNTVPEAVADVSAAIDSNTKRTRQLEWEQSEIELRKLQFQALRK